MRTRLLAALCTAPLLVPVASARAQDAESPDETEAMDVVDAPSSTDRVPQVRGAVTTAPGQVHTVIGGDTLWDLSQSYLGSPWYWPKVWSYNPEIANPHWIYPGNQVRFFPAGEGMPQQVAPARPVASSDEGGSDQFEALPSDLVTATGPLVYQQGAPTYPVAAEGFVTRAEIEGAGVIAGASTDALMLSYADVVYVKFKNRNDARVGDRYQIFRPGGAVHEPVSGKYLGHLTRILGELVVTDLSAEMVTATIQGTVDEVSRGDRVGPAGERSLSTVRPTPNRVELKGRVAAGMIPVRSLGEYHKIIVDKGSKAGVEVGNTLVIVRSGDPRNHFQRPSESNDRKYPDEAIGACIVLEVREEASICVLTRSLREIVPGDRFEMSSGATASL